MTAAFIEFFHKGQEVDQSNVVELEVKQMSCYDSWRINMGVVEKRVTHS